MYIAAMCCNYLCMLILNINVIDKHLYISCESEKRTCLPTKDDKREHAFCISRAVIESTSKTIQIKKN